MKDREVTVQVPMKASKIEPTRTLCKAVGEFPTIAWNYADQIEKLMLSETPSPEDGAELSQLVAMLKRDCETAHGATTVLAELVRSAVISDPEGRGRLQ